MVLASFFLQDSLKKIRFFEKTFLLVDTNIKVILRMLFLSFNNIDVKFTKLKKFTQRSYIVAKALSTTSQIKLINKKEFANIALDENSETFIIYILALKAIESLYLS